VYIGDYIRRYEFSVSVGEIKEKNTTANASALLFKRNVHHKTSRHVTKDPVEVDLLYAEVCLILRNNLKYC
jgi:hypothetical protein